MNFKSHSQPDLKTTKKTPKATGTTTPPALGAPSQPSLLLTTQPHSRSHHPNPPRNHLHLPAFPLSLSLPLYPTHLHPLNPPRLPALPSNLLATARLLDTTLIGLTRCTSDSGHACYTAGLAVSEAAQGCGAGRELPERVKMRAGQRSGWWCCWGLQLVGEGGFCAQVRMHGRGAVLCECGGR